MAATSSTLQALPPEQKQTTVGNYFVSNYPPFSVWSNEGVSDAERRLARPGSAETKLGVYLHIPFCRKRCNFCYFRVYTDKNAAAIQRYLDAVIAEAAMVARKPFVADRKVDFVYFGGGTPSYLSEKQLVYLFDGVREHLPWDDVREIAFECEPGTLSEKKLKALKREGVTRLSLGIEHFDDKVLEINNRAHRSGEIFRAYEWARAAGFPQINIDLIAGMVGESDEGWRRNIEQTLQLAPDAVTIYQMEVPYNTTIYKDMKEQGSEQAPVADWDTKRRWVSEAFDELIRAGFTLSSAYTAIKNDELTQFVYRDELWHGADMLALGVSSFGHIDGVHYQNNANIDPYIETVEGGKAPIFRALEMSDEERMIRQFVLQMKLGKVTRQYFEDVFSVNVLERWAGLLREYEKLGYLGVSDDSIELTRSGLLNVDRLLHGFFLPEHRAIRYV